MDVHPTKNCIFIGIDPYPYEFSYFPVAWFLSAIVMTSSEISESQPAPIGETRCSPPVQGPHRLIIPPETMETPWLVHWLSHVVTMNLTAHNINEQEIRDNPGISIAIHHHSSTNQTLHHKVVINININNVINIYIYILMENPYNPGRFLEECIDMYRIANIP